MLPGADMIITDMKTISVSVRSEDYEVFRKVGESTGRSIALLVRDAMARYRVEVLERQTPLQTLPVLSGHRSRGPLPARGDIYDEVFDREAP